MADTDRVRRRRRRRSRFAATATPALVCALVFVFVCACAWMGVGVSGILQAGGAGSALYFDWRRADIIGVEYVTTAREAFTIEFWMKLGDRHQPWHTPFAMSEAGAVDSNWFINDNGALIGFDTSHFYFYRGQNSLVCEDGKTPTPPNAACLTVVNSYTWDHIAVSWEYVTGVTTVYRNGIAMLSLTGSLLGGGRFLQKFSENPSFLLGQEPDGYSSLFNRAQAMDGFIGLLLHTAAAATHIRLTAMLLAAADEFRMWSVVRTADELQSAMRVSIGCDPVAVSEWVSRGLILLHDMDTIAGGWTSAYSATGNRLIDRSGHGNDGRLAWIPNYYQVMTYSSADLPCAATAPRPVYSTAPLAGSVPIQVSFWAGSVRPAIIALTAFDSSIASNASSVLEMRISSYPAYGTLFKLTSLAGPALIPGGGAFPQFPTDGAIGANNYSAILLTDPAEIPPLFGGWRSVRIAYQPNGAFPAAADDTFNYTVYNPISGENSTGTVILTAATIWNPQNVTKIGVENNWLTLSLGGINCDGRRLNVIIDSVIPPAIGELFQAEFTGSEDYNTPSYNRATRVLINSNNTRLTDSYGAVFFRPADNGCVYSPGGGVDPNRPYAQFTYRWMLDDSAGSGGTGLFNGMTPVRHYSEPAQVSIFVPCSNQPPVAVPTIVTVAPAASHAVLPLSSTDVDDAFGPGDGRTSESRFYTVTRYPTFGTLYQWDDASNSIDTSAAPLQPGPLVPVVQSWASGMRNASSQYTYCTAYNCSDAFTAPWTACVAACPVQSYHAARLIGPPDVYPVYGDNANNWCPACEDCGMQYVELQFPFPVFISGVDIYETWAPGGVVRVSTTKSYAGPDTKWLTLWSGITQNVPAQPRIFSPPLCPFGFVSDTIRIDVDTSIPGWQEFDAVSLKGSLMLPAGKVTSLTGKVAYAPAVGLYQSSNEAATATTSVQIGATPQEVDAFPAFDYFSFSAFDCQSSSLAPANVTVRRPSNATKLSIASGYDSGGGSDARLIRELSAFGASLPVYRTFSVAVPIDIDTIINLEPIRDSVRSNMASLFGWTQSSGGNRSTDVNLLLLSITGFGVPFGYVPAETIFQSNVRTSINGPTQATTRLERMSADGAVFDDLVSAERGAAWNVGRNATGSSFVVHPTGEIGTLRIGLWAFAHQFSYRVDVSVSLICNDQHAAILPTGHCVSCTLIPEEQLQNLTATERFAFRAGCAYPTERSSALQIVVLVITGVGTLFVLALLASVVYWREHTIIRHSSPNFCFAMLCGGVVAHAFVVLLIVEPTSEWQCRVLPWLGHIAVMMLFGPLFAKTQRLKKIFLNPKLHAIKLNDKELFGWIGVFLAFGVAYLALWSGLSPVKRVWIAQGDPTPYSYAVCASASAGWAYVAAAFEWVVLGWGSLLAYQVRNIPDNFNESRYIGIVIYNLAFCSAIILPIVWFLVVDITALLAIESVAIVLIACATLAILFVPKVVTIRALTSNVVKLSRDKQTRAAADSDEKKRKAMKDAAMAAARVGLMDGSTASPKGNNFQSIPEDVGVVLQSLPAGGVPIGGATASPGAAAPASTLNQNQMQEQKYSPQLHQHPQHPQQQPSPGYKPAIDRRNSGGSGGAGAGVAVGAGAAAVGAAAAVSGIDANESEYPRLHAPDPSDFMGNGGADLVRPSDAMESAYADDVGVGHMRLRDGGGLPKQSYTATTSDAYGGAAAGAGAGAGSYLDGSDHQKRLVHAGQGLAAAAQRLEAVAAAHKRDRSDSLQRDANAGPIAYAVVNSNMTYSQMSDNGRSFAPAPAPARAPAPALVPESPTASGSSGGGMHGSTASPPALVSTAPIIAAAAPLSAANVAAARGSPAGLANRPRLQPLPPLVHSGNSGAANANAASSNAPAANAAATASAAASAAVRRTMHPQVLSTIPSRDSTPGFSEAGAVKSISSGRGGGGGSEPGPDTAKSNGSSHGGGGGGSAPQTVTDN